MQRTVRMSKEKCVALLPSWAAELKNNTSQGIDPSRTGRDIALLLRCNACGKVRSLLLQFAKKDTYCRVCRNRIKRGMLADPPREDDPVDGDIIGHTIVRGPSYKKAGHRGRLWDCECISCGQLLTRTRDHLNRGAACKKCSVEIIRQKKVVKHLSYDTELMRVLKVENPGIHLTEYLWRFLCKVCNKEYVVNTAKLCRLKLLGKGCGCRQDTKTCQVYCIHVGIGEYSWLKIGSSVVPEERLKTIKTSCPIPPTLLYTVKGGRRREKELHALFNSIRGEGEWFENTAEIHTAFMNAKEVGLGRVIKEKLIYDLLSDSP